MARPASAVERLALWGSSLALVASCGGAPTRREQVVPDVSATLDAQPPADMVVPTGVQAVWLLRAEDLGVSAAHSVRLRVHSPDAGPVLLVGDLFVPVRENAAAAEESPFVVPRARGATDAAWMRNGTLALVVGRQLGVAGRDGFDPVLELPSDGFHVAATSDDACFVFGEGRLLVYRRGGRLLDLARLPPATAGASVGDIASVAGGPERALLALGTAVVQLEPGGAPTVIHDTGRAGPVTSLAATSQGVFVASGGGVTFVAYDGRAAVPVLRGHAAQVAASGETLYVWIDGEGLVRIAPASRYAELATAASPPSAPDPGVPADAGLDGGA